MSKQLKFYLSILISSLIYSQNNSINGFVRDNANGETLSFVNVYLKNFQYGATTNDDGYYVFSNIPDGTYTIKVLMLGYIPIEKTIQLKGDQNLTLNFRLSDGTIEGETIEVTAERELFDTKVVPSKITLSPKIINDAPAFVEADVFKAIQMLPGVVTQSDFSSALYIRGGNPSENIVLLDDVRIYNPYHLGGVFSTFNTDAIKSVDVSLGGFNARYGNGISSVISITNKDGNSDHFEGKGSISLLSSKLVLEGPIPNGSYLISGRRTYFDVLVEEAPYYFYDLHGKINYNFTDKSKLTFSGFYGDDVLTTESDKKSWDESQQKYIVTGKETTDVRFGNFSTSLKWQYVFSPKIYSDFVVSTSRFRVKLNTESDDGQTDAFDVINDITIHGDINYYPSKDHNMMFGIEYQHLDFDIVFDVEDVKLIDYTRDADFFSIYAQDNWNVTEKLNIQSGARFTYYNLGDHFKIDPRLSTRYKLTDRINLKGSVALYHQYFYTFNSEDIEFLNFVRLIDLWFPIDDRYEPIQSTHYIAGAEFMFADDYFFSVETYFKDYDHLLDMNELGDEGEDDDFLRGDGKSSGIEFLLRKHHGKFTGLLSYSLSYAEKTIELARASYFSGDNTGKKFFNTYAPSYDRRHSLTLVSTYRLNDSWKFSTRLTYNSGLPETPTIGWKKTFYLGDDPNEIRVRRTPIKAEKNSSRYPDYFRWDINIMKTTEYESFTAEYYLQIINVTNHQNILIYSYDLEPRIDGNQQILPAKRTGIPMFPFIPTVGVNFKF